MSSTSETADSTETADEKLSRDLNMDVVAVEQQIRFRLDLARIQRGEPGKLGYVLIDRERNPNAAVVFATPAEAEDALENHILIDSLCEEDAQECYVPTTVGLDELAGREIILP